LVTNRSPEDHSAVLDALRTAQVIAWLALAGIVAKAKVAVIEGASYSDFAATICLSI
jgi:hypothetical protein